MNRKLIGMGLAIGLGILVFSGCDQPQQDPKYHKLVTAWPIFDVEKWEGENEDGSRWEREKGDAIVWLATWDKERKYDKDGFLIYRREKSGFFPLWSAEEEEGADFIRKEGVVLIYPYKSTRQKNGEIK